MAYNEAETRFYLIDPVPRDKGYDAHWKLKLETPAPVEPERRHIERGPCTAVDDEATTAHRQTSQRSTGARHGVAASP